MPGRSFESPGRCIYCGDLAKKRTREHIFPKAIGGNWVIQDASCDRCQDLIGRVEVAVHRGHLIGPRRKLGLKGHSSRDERKKLPLWAETPEGERRFFVEADDYPAIITYPKHTVPGWMTNPLVEPPQTKLEAFVERQIDFRQQLLIDKYGIDKPIFNLLMINDLMRYLAKIAHAGAVSKLGVSGFTPFLPLHILNRDEKSDTLLRYIGGMPGEPLNKGSHNLDVFDVVGSNGQRFHGVRVQLFAQFEMPAYAVLVGSAPGTPVPDWVKPPA